MKRLPFVQVPILFRPPLLLCFMYYKAKAFVQKLLAI